MIYADHAATTALSHAAYAAMQPWLRNQYGNPSALYSLAREPRKAIEAARQSIADLIHAIPEEIFFTSGGTESDNWAIKGTALARGKKGTLLTSAFEHHAVLRTCEVIEEQLWPVAYLYPDRDGIVTPGILSRQITEETKMVSIMTANNELGTIQPIQELSSIVHRQGALFHTDAVQAVGHIPINVNEMNVDLLSASAHKFNGPKGVGFLYIRKGTPIAPYENGGDQEASMRAGTENVAGIVGMAVALKENVSRLEQNQKHLTELEERLLDRIKGLTYVRNCAKQKHLPGLLSLSFPGYDGEMILHRMDLMGICISTGSACDSKRTVISHVLQAIHAPEDIARGTIRISFGIDNSEEEVDAIANGLCKILNAGKK